MALEGRKRGHVKSHESISDWEVMWVSAYSSEGFGYRVIASLVYGVPAHSVTAGEMYRVGAIARAAKCGCNRYRTGANQSALDRLRMLAREYAGKDAPKIVPSRFLSAAPRHRKRKK